MTLREVLSQIPAVSWRKRVPSVVRLVKEDIPVLHDQMDEKSSVTIYSNGYVVYQSDKRATVFPLHDCKDYEYKTVEETRIIPFSEFADQPWQVRVLMEGKDRLVHNGNNRKEGRTVSIDTYDTEARWEELSDRGMFDPLRILVEQEEKREEIVLLNRYLAKLTDRQREVLILCVVEGKTHVEAAEMLGISHQAISDSLKKSLYKLRRMYGLKEKIGGRNCFCRACNSAGSVWGR